MFPLYKVLHSSQLYYLRNKESRLPQYTYSCRGEDSHLPNCHLGNLPHMSWRHYHRTESLRNKGLRINEIHCAHNGIKGNYKVRHNGIRLYLHKSIQGIYYKKIGRFGCIANRHICHQYNLLHTSQPYYTRQGCLNTFQHTY